MSDLSEEDVERLASRVAMMASEEGEAANAGRAVAHLARRLGLTGGALKEMFIYGAKPSLSRPAPAPSQDTERLEREIGVLRKSVRLLEANYRDLEGQRDSIARELDTLRSRTSRARNRWGVSLLLLGAVALAAIGGMAVGWLISSGYLDRSPGFVPTPATKGSFVLPGADQTAVNPTATAEYGPVVRRVGIIRVSRAVARQQPDAAAPTVATLLQGAPVVVRRIFGPTAASWAEIEVGSSIGYVMATEIDLS